MSWARAGDYFIVNAGLDAGERVVTNGAFKIDSALQIQAKPSMMNPQGGSSVPGHNHGGDNEHAGHQMSAEIEIAVDQAVELMPLYLAMQAALAGDDLSSAKKQAKAMMAITGHSGALPKLLHDMLAAESLEAIRRPHFETLSNALIAAAKKAPASMPENLIIMHCPMVYGDRGADWLQASEPLQNPYFGAMMLKCGEIKKRIGSESRGHEGYHH